MKFSKTKLERINNSLSYEKVGDRRPETGHRGPDEKKEKLKTPATIVVNTDGYTLRVPNR